MTDYSKLVEALRCGEYKPECGSSDCPYWSGLGCMDGQLMEDAAAAIEALQAQLPKRGEWIIDGAYTYNLRELNGKAYEPVYRCSRCNRQTESYVRLDEPKMPEDADFPEYCPHCGAKMEVQE